MLKLLQGTNGWIHSKGWSAVVSGAGKNNQSFHGLNHICDGGYLRWPCLAYPLKTGLARSQTMRWWSAMLESISKDIEGVFGILKKRFVFLKVFNHMHHHHQHIDNAFFTSCCILHNILLKEDGYISSDLPNYPSGGVVKALLNKITNDPRADGLWICDERNDETFEVALADKLLNSPDLESQSAHGG